MQIRQHTGTDRPAVVLYPSGTAVTFDELEARANRLAHALRADGLREGDAVAIVMENNEHYHAVQWAARRCGLYYVPINTHLTVGEAAYIVENSGARVVVGSVATSGTFGQLPGWRLYPQYAAGQPDTPIDDEVEGDLLQYSSGTTGLPKGIKRPLLHRNPADTPGPLAGFVATWMRPGAVFLSPAPLYHTAPSMWTMAALAAGVTVVIMGRFDAEGCLAAVERHRVTHALLVPAMFTRMLKLPGTVRDSYDVSSLERVLHGAGPCPAGIKRQMIDWWGPIVDEYYASSEAVGLTFISGPEWLAHPGSVGLAGPAGAHILDDEGHEQPPGREGGVYFENGAGFEYLNAPEKTMAARDGRGWVTVGDIGYTDDEGYLYLTDRRHHMIISGGVNIYPQEAESVLVLHPKVLDAAVFGIPDDEMGQSVKAVVQTVDPADATDELAAELLDWLRDRLAHYKCPRSISFEAQLPRTDAGKLYKHQLIARYS